MDDYTFSPNLAQGAGQEAQDYNFGPPAGQAIPDSPIAQARAQKWDFGLGEDSPGASSLFSSIMLGKENEERKIQAIRQGLRNEQIKNRLIEQHIRSNQGKLDPGTVAMIKETPSEALDSPDALKTYFEKRYAERLLSSAVAHSSQVADPTNDGRTFLERDPERANQMMDFASHLTTIKEATQKKLEDLEKKYENTSWTGKVLPKLERFVNPVFDARLKTNFFSLRGNDLTQQYNDIYTMGTPAQAMAKAEAVADAMYEKNPEAAIEWLRGLISYSGSQALLDNITTAADYAPVTGVVPYKAIGQSAFGQLLKATVKAAGNRTLGISPVLEAAGDLTGAGAVRAGISLERRAAGLGENLDELYSKLPTIYNPKGLFEGSANLARQAQDNIVNQIQRGNQAIAKALTDMVRLGRLQEGSLSLGKAFEEAKATWKLENPRIAANVLDVSPANLEEGATSARFLKIKLGETTPIETELARGASEALARLEKVGGSKFKWQELVAQNLNDNGVQRTLIPANQDTATYGWARSSLTGQPEAKALKQGNDNIKVVLSGHDLKAFPSEKAAERAAREDFGLTKFQVVPDAGGYVVQVVKAVDERLPTVRNALSIDLERSGTPRIPLQVFLGRLVTKDSTMSADFMENAKTAAYGSKALVEALEIAAAPIRELRQKAGKKTWDEFTTFLDRQKMERDVDGVIGRYSVDQAGFEADWAKQFQRLPSEQESAAYWSYVSVMDQDLAVNNLGIYRDKSRAGYAMYGLKNDYLTPPEIVPPAPNTGPLKADIEGRLARELPFDAKEHWNVLMWEPDGHHTLLSRVDFKGSLAGQRELVKEGLASGKLRAVQLSQEGEKALREKLSEPLQKEWKNERIHFVLTDADTVSEPIGMSQLPRRGGGHHVYDYQWMVRQPELLTNKGALSTRTTYMGDLSLYGASTEKDAKLFVDRWNTARLMLKEDNPNLGQYLADHLPINEEDFRKLYQKTYDINTPVYHTPMNTTVDQYHKLADTFTKDNPHHQYVRASDGEFSMSRDLNLRWAQERGEIMGGIEVDHSPTNPTIQIRRGEFLDPVVTMDRAAKSIMGSVYLNDLKHKSVENFIAEFASVLRPNIAELRRDPLAALMHAPFKPDADPAAVAAAKDFRRTTLELLHIKSEEIGLVDRTIHKLKEGILGTSVGKMVADWELNILKDPIRYMRSAAFNLKIGLFNPASFFQQAMITAHIAGVEGPVAASKAAAAYSYNKLLSRTTDDATWAHWSSRAAEVAGIKAETFRELSEALRRSQYGKVGLEVSDMGYWDSPKLIQGKFGKVLDAGKVPFNMGEGMGREVGFWASAIRFVEKNPGRKIDDGAIREIINRADMLNLNMSSVSNADWQKGLLGIPTQFFGVHTRLVEQVLGKRLTPKEAARVFAVNSALFGIPTAAGGFAALWPVGESLKETALDKGYRPEENPLTNIMVNGVPSVISKYLTGVQGDYSKLGMGGLSVAKDIKDGRKEALELIGGVSGRTLKDMWAMTDPLMAVLKSRGDYPLTSQDFVNAARNMSSFSSFEKMYMAVARHEWATKQDGRLTDIDPWNGMMMALTGTQPLAISDMYRMINDKKQLESWQQKQEKEYGQNRRLAMEALSRGDNEGFKAYMKRAEVNIVDGRFRPDQIGKMIQRADDNSASLLVKVQESFYKQDPQRIEGWYYDLTNNPKKAR